MPLTHLGNGNTDTPRRTLWESSLGRVQALGCAGEKGCPLLITTETEPESETETEAESEAEAEIRYLNRNPKGVPGTFFGTPRPRGALLSAEGVDADAQSRDRRNPWTGGAIYAFFLRRPSDECKAAGKGMSGTTRIFLPNRESQSGRYAHCVRQNAMA